MDKGTMESSLNETETLEGIPIQEVAWFRALKYTLYAIMFLISLPGNLMVCVIIIRRRKMKTITNFLILNLAVSDVLYTIYVPFDIVISESDTWPYHDSFCKIFYPLMTLSICVSAFTLMALALSRFWAVVFPLHRQVSVFQIKILLAVIWFLSVIEILPYALFLHISPELICEESWPSDKSKKTYTLMLFLLQFVIPLTTITLAYTMIGLELKKSSQRTENKTLERTRNDESRKIIRMLIIVTVTFAFCNLPTSTMWMINDFGKTNISGFDDIVSFFNILDFGNAAANPCIYLACNQEFRREFHLYLTKLKRKVCSICSSSDQTLSRLSARSEEDYEHKKPQESCVVNKSNQLDPSCSMLLKESESCL